MITLENSHELRVRFAETDKMGVVYNSNYFIYFETGRNELMRNFGISSRLFGGEDGVYFPLVESYAKYISPASYDETLAVTTRFIYDNSLIMKFEYIIRRMDVLICEGWTKHCFISAVSMKPVRPPKSFIDVIKNYGTQS